MRMRLRFGRFGMAMAAALTLGMLLGAAPSPSLAQQQPPQAEPAPNIPTESMGTTSDSDIWRQIRQGVQGNVSIPNKQAGQLIQSEGDNWRAWRNGPISVYGSYAILGIILVLALFFLLRGRIRIEHGPAGVTIRRFRGIERFGHWLIAVSFVILGLTGLNMLYGRYALKPIMGPESFANLTILGKWLHDYVAFAFMVGLVFVFVAWIWENLPSRYDLNWALKGGGLFAKGVHPPARKFNFGQKVIFWAVVLGGISISLSGLSLLFPFQMPLFAKTFELLNPVLGLFGYRLPTELTALQEMQLAQSWHAVVALVLVVIIIAHIYLGTIGMEGAFDAMGSGRVDLNWAKEHHSVWVDELEKKGKLDPQPAEPPPVRPAAQPAE